MIFNTENIAYYIKDEKALLALDGDVLKTLAQKYKYSGVLQLLYSKYLKLHKSAEFEEQVEWCSTIVHDRKKVYELLFQPGLKKIIENDVFTEETKPTVEPESEDTLPSVESKDDLQPENTELQQEEETPPILAEVENTDKVTSKEIKPKDKELDILENQILAQAVSSGLLIDIESEYKQQDKLEKKDEPTEHREVEDTQTEQVAEEIVQTPRTFLDWLEKPKEQPRKEQLEKPKKNTESIIDSFLNKTTKKSKASKETFSPTNMAKMSLVENNQFVTETLANIYAKQGKIDKAIEIYEQLSLKNPKKKTFFASRIRFLKEKQQYNN